MRYNLKYLGMLFVLTSILMSTKAEAKSEYLIGTPFTRSELHCLALNVYFESRGESSLGQKAVAWVTLNRSYDSEYPDDICDVVYDGGQFVWTTDKYSNEPIDSVAWAQALHIAYDILKSHKVKNDPTDGAVMFHTLTSKPYWRKSYVVTAKIDGHIFYKKETDNG